MKENFYIDNEKFCEALTEHRNKCIEADNCGEEIPPLSNYIGECFILISKNIAHMPNFIGYTYIDEMIGDGIENCLRAVRNFDPEKSKYAFTYFSKIVFWAFVRRLVKEKKQQEIKYKIIEEFDIASCIDSEDEDLTRYLQENARKKLDEDTGSKYNRAEKQKKVVNIFD